MGSIVKSIGKAIKKVGKGIKKIVKKIGPALLVAAAVYTGVALLGAGGMAGGIGSLSPTNFSAGLTRIGSFFGIGDTTSSGVSSVVPIGEAASLGGTVEAVVSPAPVLADVISDFASGNAVTGVMNPLTSASDALSGVSGVGSAATNAGSSVLSNIKDFIFASNGEMTTGQALAYMTKVNMIKTGVDVALGFFDTSEQDLLEQKHKYDLEIIDKQAGIESQMQASAQAHDQSILDQKYAYGAPSGGGSGTFTHPSLMPAGSQQMQRMPSGQMQLANLATQFAPQQNAQYQSIGQPTLGRARTRNFENSVPSAASPRAPGLLTQAARKEIV